MDRNHPTTYNDSTSFDFLQRIANDKMSESSLPPGYNYMPTARTEATQQRLQPNPAPAPAPNSPPGLNPIPQYRNHEWSPSDLPPTPSTSQVPRPGLPDTSPKFDSRCMLWWSQWEIVFAKSKMRLSDQDTCSLFRYRWREKDRSTRYMQPHHVAEIFVMLSDGHPWHEHAWRFGDQGKENMDRIRNEFTTDLRVAQVHGF